MALETYLPIVGSIWGLYGKLPYKPHTGPSNGGPLFKEPANGNPTILGSTIKPPLYIHIHKPHMTIFNGGPQIRDLVIGTPYSDTHTQCTSCY